MISWGYLFLAILIILILIFILWWAVGSGCGFGGGRGNGGTRCVGATASTGSTTLLVNLNTGQTGASGPYELAADSGWFNVANTTVNTCNDCDTLLATFSTSTNVTVFDEQLYSLVGATTSNFSLVEVQVLLDGVSISPSPVVFNSILNVVENTAPSELTSLQEQLLSLSTANSFTFVQPSVCRGCHTVQVQARITVFSIVTADSIASALGFIGYSTLVATSGPRCCPPRCCSKCGCSPCSCSRRC